MEYNTFFRIGILIWWNVSKVYRKWRWRRCRMPLRVRKRGENMSAWRLEWVFQSSFNNERDGIGISSGSSIASSRSRLFLITPSKNTWKAEDFFFRAVTLQCVFAAGCSEVKEDVPECGTKRGQTSPTRNLQLAGGLSVNKTRAVRWPLVSVGATGGCRWAAQTVWEGWSFSGMCACVCVRVLLTWH